MSMTAEDFPPTFGPQGGATTQPGGIHPGSPPPPAPPAVRRQGMSDGLITIDQPADKYGVVGLLVDNKKVYQLLPADPYRKRASISHVSAQAIGLGIVIGQAESLDTFVGNAAASILAAGVMAGFPLGITVLNAPTPLFLYTAKAPLYAIGLGAVGYQVSVMVERFDSGVPIT